MLRLAVMILASLFLVIAVAATLYDSTAWPMLIGAGVLMLGTLGERFHYGAGDTVPDKGNWQRTDERFLDEQSGRRVTVWFNPATGERRYIEGE